MRALFSKGEDSSRSRGIEKIQVEVESFFFCRMGLHYLYESFLYNLSLSIFTCIVVISNLLLFYIYIICLLYALKIEATTFANILLQLDSELSKLIKFSYE